MDQGTARAGRSIWRERDGQRAAAREGHQGLAGAGVAADRELPIGGRHDHVRGGLISRVLDGEDNRGA